MQYFTPENWNHCQYLNETKKAIISFGANPSDSGEVNFIYYITILDEDNKEHFQSQYLDLDEACSSINTKFSELWEFKDLSAAPSGGCSSCEAH